MDKKFEQCMSAMREECDKALKGMDSELLFLADDLLDLCKNLLFDQDISLAIAMIFDRENGIFSVVERLIPARDRNIQKAREKLLTLVAEFIKMIGQKVIPYTLLVKKSCLNVFHRDDSRSVQAAALVPLLSLFEFNSQSKGCSDAAIDWTTVETMLLQYKKAKTSGSCLRSNILTTLGCTVESFPSFYTESNVSSLLKLCLDTLEEQLHKSGRDLSYVLISGAVKCLDSLLTWFDDTLPAGGSVENSRRSYLYLEQVIHYREDLRRYDIAKAGLRLLGRHASRFRIAVFENSLEIMKWLHAYCLHNNSDLRAAALPAYDAFLSQVASCLLSEDERIKHAHQIYKSLLTEILKILDSHDKLPKLTSIAIRAVGKLASAIVKYSGNDSLKQAFERLMPFASTFRRGEAGHEELGYSITLVGAFASIILHLGKVEDSMVSLVTEVTGNIFYQFPFLFPKQKQAVYPTLSSLLKSLFQKGAIFSLFLSNVVWSSLERTMEATVEEPEGVRLPLWPHYVELWCHILDSRSDGTDSFAIIDKEENLSGIVAFNIGEVNVNTEELRSLIFDTLMRNIMKAMSELNLKYKVRVPDKEDQNRIAAGDNEDKEIEAEAGIIEPLDVFQMRKFLNLVEFVQGILSSQHAPLLLKWTYTFGRFLVELSVHYPLISGFYKILATTISVADRQGYFKAMDNVKDNEINETVRVEVDERCYSLFSAYLKDVLVRSRRYKLELLVACLQLCLSAPHALLDIPSLLGPTKRALQIGLRYSPIATVAIDALERWQDAYPEELQVHLYEIVPYLSNYLFEIIPTVHPKSVKMAMSSNRSGQRDGSQLNSFEDLQVKIQQFLGRIGNYSHYLVPDINLLQVSGTGGLAWDTIDQVKFTLPFRDEKFDTYLDSLLSRIAELALSSTDRKTKVVSCELLHAVCLFMLGSSAKGPAQKRNSQAHSSSVKYDKLYRKIFPVILQLATDLDLVTQQLFGSFSKQLIHWMTSNTQRENPETMALLDAILDGLVDVEKGSLREFSADCFGEFLLWSVRHTAPEANDFVNVTSMLDRLYNRMGHPSPYHRLGAAMAVHRIYPVLRGHASIVERYILELSFFCLKSLRLAEDDHEHIGTIKQINKAIDGILKLIIRNLVALQKPRKNRPMFTNLEEFLEWLLLQSSQLLVNCRTRCMHMLSVICRELEGGSCSYWFQTKFSSIKRIEYLVNIFDVHSTSESASSDENRLKFLHCAFQWTGWALREKLISIDELASVMKNPSYNICIIIESFISKILDQASPHNQLDETFGNSLKGSTIFSFLSLVKEALHLEIGLKEENDFRSLGLGYVLPLKSNLLSQALMVNQGKFIHMLCIILLHPAGLGISHSQTSRRGLAELAVTLLWWLTRTCMDFKEGLIEVLHQLFEVGDLSYGASYFQQIFGQGLLSLKPQNIPNMLDLVNGYQSLHLVGVLVPALGKSKAKELGAQLLTSAYNIQKDIPPSLETIATELLTLSFCLGVELEEVLNLVSESEFEIKVGNIDRNLTKGAIFYLNFRKSLIQQVKFSYQRCLHYLIGQSVHNQSCKLLLEALLEDYLCKKGASITTGSFVLEFLKHMQLLKPCCSVEASLPQREFLLNIMYKLLLVDKSSVLCQNNPSFHFFIESSFFFLEFGNTHGLSSKDYVTTLSQKCKALLLVPFLATVSDEVCGRLVETLTRLVTNHLLVEDAELPSGSNLRANFLQLLDTLLKCITAASKIGFLEVLFPLLQNPKKITFKPIVQALEDIAGNIEETLPAFAMCLQLLHDSSKLPRLRRSVVDNFFVPLVHSSSIDFVVMWYAEHIGHIVDLISKPIDHDAMDRESEEEEIQVRISHYTIIDVLFVKVDGQIIKEKLSSLVSNQQLMKLASNESRAKNDPVLYRFPENVILWRDLHVSAYSCLASVMMRTQEQEKLFTILFKDYAGNPLWQHLIDCTKVYKEFPVETSQSQMFSDVVKGIRLESKSRRKVSTDISQALSTQYVMGTTLSQEPSLISSFVGHRNEDETKSDMSPGSGKDISLSDDVRNNEEKKVIEIVAMDKDEFDQNPCMGVVLKVIEHLYLKFLTRNALAQQMPEWVRSFCATLENTATPVNVRLFLAKVVTKSSKIFASYADKVYPPLVQTIIDNPHTTGGCCFHYLLRDICIVVLQWKIISPDKCISSRFINYLITVSVHESRQVLRENIEIVKAYLESWKDHLCIDKSVILNYVRAGGINLSAADKQFVAQRLASLQVIGAIASLETSIYTAFEKISISRETLHEVLLSNVKSKVKEVSKASAELLGLVFKERDKEVADPGFDLLKTNLRQHLMNLQRAGDYGQCLIIFERITLHCPALLESYIFLVVDLLPHLHGVFKTIVLDVFLRHPISVCNHFSMVMPFLSKVFVHRDESAQIKSLKIVLELIKSLSEQDISDKLLPVLSESFKKHDSRDCRLLFLEVLIFLYNTRKMISNKFIKDILLSTLCDTSDIVREASIVFWDLQLHESFFHRFNQMIVEMYNPEVEPSWTQFSVVLLLKLCERSVDYKRPIFNAPLSNCEFYEQKLDTSWLRGSLPMTPLFSETQGTQKSSLEPEIGNMEAGMIRATVTVSPSFTLGYGDRSTGSFSVPLSLHASESTSVEDLSSRMLVDPVTKFKRRIYRPTAGHSQNIRGILNANRRKEARLVQQASDRANKVKILRHYRTGELPDIEINHEDIIVPMAALAEKDKTFSRLLLVLLFQSMDAVSRDGADGSFRLSRKQGIEAAFEKTHGDIVFVGSLQSLCIKDSQCWINPKLVGSTSLKSFNFHVGIELLENLILYATAPEILQGTSKRQKRSNIPSHKESLDEAWLELAHLYSALGENDVVLSIYMKHLTTQSITHDALQAELRGESDWALLLYDKAIEQLNSSVIQGLPGSISKIEEELWYNERLKCLAELNRWGEVMEDTLLQLQSEDSGEYNFGRLWHPSVHDPYLRLFIKGTLKVPAYHSFLREFLRSSVEDASRRDTLFENFGSEIASLAILNDETDQARFYISECYRYFRKKWSTLHPLAVAARHFHIRHLQKIFEMDEFVNCIQGDTTEDFARLSLQWEHRWPSSNWDDIEVWDDILQNRLMFFHKFQVISKKILKEESKVSLFISQLDVRRGNYFRNAAKGAAKLGSFIVAQKYMNEYMAIHQGFTNKSEFDSDFFKELVKLRCRQASRVVMRDIKEAIAMMEQVLNYIQSTLKKPLISRNLQYLRLLRSLEGDVSNQLGWLNFERMLDDDTGDSLFQGGISKFGSAFKAYNAMLENTTASDSTHRRAKASFKYACFCDELLSATNDTKWDLRVRKVLQVGSDAIGLPSSDVYPKLIVTHIMEALVSDSSLNTHHGVSRILSLTGQFKETHASFMAYSERVPSWIFIPWIPQMLAVLDKDEGQLFVGVLQGIAKTYPQALYYAVHVSRGDFGPTAHGRIENVLPFLRNPLLESFVNALEDLTFPERRLYDGLLQIKAQLISCKHDNARELYSNLFMDCLDVAAMKQSNRQAGDYNLKFARDYSKRMIKALGDNGCKLQSMDEGTFSTVISDIITNLRKALENLPSGRWSLSSFSKWMADFDQSARVMEGYRQKQYDKMAIHADIEIPGQYLCSQKPDPQSHIKLVGFDQNLIALSSKQRPKILTMRGSDEKDYKFVVKGGEDLRLDQRIEQLFEVMNGILHKNAVCASRNLSIRTYSIIPISKQCGLLQFVENTSVLEDVIKDGLRIKLPVKAGSKQPSDEMATAFLINLRQQYQQWVQTKGGAKTLYESYQKLYTRVDYDELSKKLASMVSQVPWDALKTGIARVATSTESFLTLRSQFARSLAVNSVCGYVAGVGDRHLGNTLIDMQNGTLISIDFGYSFGTSVIMLPVPELIPFRLTPQLVNLLLPLDALGLLKNDMVRTMTALHSGRQVISSVMDVFVKEPLVEWKNEAIKAGTSFTKGSKPQEDEYMDVEKAHVELKVENAQRKLKLWNPADITIGELRSSVHVGKPYLPALESMVRGDINKHFRSQVKRKVCKSVQEQVDCLVDQATDPSLLACLWLGWQAWV